MYSTTWSDTKRHEGGSKMTKNIQGIYFGNQALSSVTGGIRCYPPFAPTKPSPRGEDSRNKTCVLNIWCDDKVMEREVKRNDNRK